MQGRGGRRSRSGLKRLNPGCLGRLDGDVDDDDDDDADDDDDDGDYDDEDDDDGEF